jgi:hypothetical protein
MKKPLILFFIFLFLITGCGLQGKDLVTQATVAKAAQEELATATPTPTLTPRPTRRPTRAPPTLTPTPLPTDTPTITPPSTPVIIRACIQRFLAVNVRSAPRLSAPRTQILELGTCIDQFARSRDRAWAKFDQGWIQVELFELSNSVNLLPIAER